MAEEEFYNFDEALDQLNLKEEELKRLVSEGEIRAFREGDTMKLRRNDVETLKSELMGGDIVDLGSSGEELVFEDDLELDDAGMATEEISEMDTLVDPAMIEDVGVEDMDIEEVGLADTAEVDVELEPAGAAPVVRRGGAQQEDQGEGPLFRAVLILTTVALVLAIPLVVSITKGNTGAIAESVAGMFGVGDEE